MEATDDACAGSIIGESALASRQRSERDAAAACAAVDAPVPTEAQADAEPQTLLVLAGLPGSGKSTFAHALVLSGVGGRKWVRASQDDSRSGRRQEVEDDVRAALARGENVVVDRVDFNAAQRAYFVELGREATPRPRIECLVLTLSGATLRARLEARNDHPTLTDPERALAVLARMRRDWEPPTAAEGFDRVLTLAESDTPPAWTPNAVAAVLARLHASMPPHARRAPAYAGNTNASYGNNPYASNGYRHAQGQGYGAYRGRGRGAPTPYAQYNLRGGYGAHSYGPHSHGAHSYGGQRGAPPTRAWASSWSRGPPRGVPRAPPDQPHAPQAWHQPTPPRPLPDSVNGAAKP